MKVEIFALLASIWSSSTVQLILKEFELHTVHTVFGTLEKIKRLQLFGQAAEFTFKSKL